MSNQFKPAPCDINLRGTLKVFVTTSKIVADVLEHLKSIPEIKDLQNSLQFLEYTASLVENMCSKKASDDEKFQIILKIYYGLFDEVNLNTLRSNLDYIKSNKLVHKISIVKSFFSSIRKLL